MCRLVGIVSSEITEFGAVLREAPRSLAWLSREHPDGWGIAEHDGSAWQINRGTNPAGECAQFMEIASRSRGKVLIAHVRQKTVGTTRIENTHPFTQSGWVFAHNGTLVNHASLREEISPERLAQITGDTDSEVLFAFFLTRLDAAGSEDAGHIVERATAELRAQKAGAFNFLLANGTSCFAHRFGRSLYILERPNEMLVASEQLTDEAWCEVPEGTFLRIDAPTIANAA